MTILSDSRSLTSHKRSSSIPQVVNGVVKVTASSLRGPVLQTTSAPISLQSSTASSGSSSLLAEFIRAYHELEAYKSGKPVLVDGHTLSIPAVAAAARYQAQVRLDESPQTRTRLQKSRDVIAGKVDKGSSVYGVSTGFGGSADTRTDQPLLLGNALLQHQQAGVLPSSKKPLDALPLLDPMGSAMPEAWVRGAMLIRMNSLIRGHSGVRWELIEKMNDLLRANITPVVPVRGSISASGDLSPLSYIAGALTGNPSVRMFDGDAAFGAREMYSSIDVLRRKGIAPIPLASKEHLGILNGTAFSASVGALALNDAVHLTLLSQVCTAMGVEALAGTRASFDPFIHVVARPHPGQVESADIIWNLLEGSKFASTHEEEVSIKEDEGTLRQDRYPLRTAPQFMGPQIEDLLASLSTITQECNSTTDNPLVDGETGEVHHGGNFQAMAVTNAMEKTRLSLHHLGKLLFAQCAELVNPAMNRGLPPSLAATDPSLDYHGKGIDIATAAYVAELGYLANPVSTHIQSAEMHNQAVNSLALISGRQTLVSLDVLSMLVASYLYMLCQALDLRAMQSEMYDGLVAIVSEESSAAFGAGLRPGELSTLSQSLNKTAREAFDGSSTMDGRERMHRVAAACTIPLVDMLSVSSPAGLMAIPQFRTRVAERGYKLLDSLREAYLSGAKGPAPASAYINKTRPVYEFVRCTLGIRMHGSENYSRFKDGLGVQDQTVGQNVSLIYEAMRDGKMQPVIVGLFQ